MITPDTRVSVTNNRNAVVTRKPVFGVTVSAHNFVPLFSHMQRVFS